VQVPLLARAVGLRGQSSLKVNAAVFDRVMPEIKVDAPDVFVMVKAFDAVTVWATSP
jgi:hypothetical protein